MWNTQTCHFRLPLARATTTSRAVVLLDVDKGSPKTLFSLTWMLLARRRLATSRNKENLYSIPLSLAIQPFFCLFAHLPSCPVAYSPICPFVHSPIRPFAHLPTQRNKTRHFSIRPFFFSFFLSIVWRAGWLAGWLVLGQTEQKATCTTRDD